MSELIKKDVKEYISSFANYPVSNTKDSYVLKKSPLYLDDTKLGFLALSLRDYVKRENPSETVLANELRKPGFTVKDTYELVKKKIEA
jgi:hypothetical protein